MVEKNYYTADHNGNPVVVEPGYEMASDGNPVNEADLIQSVLEETPTSIATDGNAVFDTHGATRLTIISAANAVVTYSLVDSIDASAHDTVSTIVLTAGASGLVTALDVVWPFYRVSTATAGCRVARAY